MKLYQLVGRGPYTHLAGEGTTRSRIVYSREPTREEMQEFIEDCCYGNTLGQLSIAETAFSVIELELKED